MTMQMGDTLLWQGLEHALRGGGPLLGAWPEKDRPEFEAMSTACWRGFIATWLVDEQGWLRVASVRTGTEMQEIPQPEEPRLSDAVVMKPREEQRRKIIESFPSGERPSEEVINQLLEFFGKLGKAKKKLVMGASERLYDLFPGCDGPVAATWFTGVLETGHGKPVRRRPYQVVYPHYRIFHVEAGKVIRIDDHDSTWREKR